MNLYRRCIAYCWNLNLFPSVPPSTDAIVLSNQLISTRIFIALLVASTINLFLHITTTPITTPMIVNTPSYIEYLHLHAQHSSSLDCPCSRISIDYQSFVHINYTQHQLCSSVFMTDGWINYLLNVVRQLGYYYHENLLVPGVSTSQGLRSFCNLTKQSIDHSLIRFYTDQYITATVASLDTFQVEIENAIQVFRSSVSSNLLLSFDVVQNHIKANALGTGRLTNFVYFFTANMLRTSYVDVKIYDECRCDQSPLCFTNYSNSDDPELKRTVAGLYAGCFIVEALLKSDLRCFYDPRCLSEWQSYRAYSNESTASALDPSRPSRYTTTATIQELLSELMIETWTVFQSHETYFYQCLPTICTYTQSVHHGVVYIFTTLFSLVGGLVTVLKLIIPFIVKYGRKVKERQIYRTGHSKSCCSLTIECHLLLVSILGQGWNMSITRFVSKIVQQLIRFNVYQRRILIEDGFNDRYQLISTRLFICVLCVTTIVLASYLLSSEVSQMDLVKSPSIDEYSSLYASHAPTLFCPCSQISVDYQEFFHVNYSLHPICESVYITPEWIDYLISASRPESALDFKWIGRFAFQALRSYCELSEKTIITVRDIFYSIRFVTNVVIPRDRLHLETNIMLDRFISAITSQLLSSLKTVQDIYQVDSIFSAMGTQFKLRYVAEIDKIVSVPQLYYGGCDCIASDRCTSQAAIFDTSGNVAFRIPGLYHGCWMSIALLQSTLECFYDETCINTYLSYLTYYPSINMSLLVLPASKRFHLNSTIQELLDQIMVDQWHLSTDYDQYYQICQPQYCTYTYTTRNDLLFIITKVFGLVGGLHTILKWMIGFIVKCIYSLIRRMIREQRNRITGVENGKTMLPIHDYLIKAHQLRLSSTDRYDSNRAQPMIRFLWTRLYQRARRYNLFTDTPPTLDPWKLRNQRIATRVFVGLSSISTSVLLFYNTFVATTKLITITNPSVEQYYDLYSLYSKTVSCSCSQVSIQYDRFFHVHYIRHEICESFFVSAAFRDLFFHFNGDELLEHWNFRTTGLHVFRGLAVFCDITRRTIEASLINFNSTQYITATVQSRRLFNSTTKVLFDQFITSTTRSLLVNLQINRDLTHVNTLFSARFTNYHFYYVITNNLLFLTPITSAYSGCGCAISPKCVRPAAVLAPGADISEAFVIPGLYSGCYTSQALLQSTLECFYNITCLFLVRSHLAVNSSTEVSILNQATLQRSSISSTIQELIENLMVERWEFSASFDDYYNGCKPRECTYTDTIRHDLVYIISTVFGLVGGLFTVLHFCVPRLVNIIAQILLKLRRRQIVPFIPNAKNRNDDNM